MTTAIKPTISALDVQTYSHPIPNRSFILELLKKHGKALNRKQLAKRMKLSCSEEYEALRRRLRAMERDGQLAFDRHDGYRLLTDQELVFGRVIAHRDGLGYLACDEGGDDLLLNHRDMMHLFDGDRIQARVAGVDHRGRGKAALVKVIEHNTSQVAGKLCFDEDGYFVKPENSRYSQEIDVNKDHLMNAKEGQYVVVTITDYPCSQYRAYGNITEVLGDENTPGIEIELAIRKHSIPFVWPAKVHAAANAMGTEVNESDKLHRVDLRHLPFVTIDGVDAKDFDDAIYCEPQAGGGWRLWVAIADVSHYVTPDSDLDREAQKRGTSVYFPGHVVPMLPEALSNGLCSLKPKVDRLAITCEMSISATGKMTRYQFSEAVIKSHARLSYDQVNALLTAPNSNRGKRASRKHAALLPHIEALHQLYGALRTARSGRGAIDFDTPEVQFQFDQCRKISQILPVERNDAHKLVEECMLCANVATARFLKKLKLPALYRNHKGPRREKLNSLKAFLGEKGLTLAGGNKPAPIHYDQLLSSLDARPDVSIIQAMMLRSLSQAEYSPNNTGHFGLAYSAYAHFTSPIRRYPDLLVHRAIRSVIRGQESGNIFHRALKRLSGAGTDPVLRIKSADPIDPAVSYPYNRKHMEVLAADCSRLSRRADKASWAVDASLKCEYMKDAVGKAFTGQITTVTRFGLFIELADTKIEGLIHVSRLNKDFYHFDEAKQCLKGERTNTRHTLGDTVQVKIAHVDLDQKKIELALV